METPKVGRKKSILTGVGVTVGLLIATGSLLNIWLGNAARQNAREQFNAGQLAVAQAIRSRIENQIAFLGKELRLLARNMERIPADSLPPDPSALLQPCFERVTELGVGRIEWYDSTRRLKISGFPYTGRTRTETVTEMVLPMENGTDTERTLSISQPMGEGSDLHLYLSVRLTRPEIALLTFDLDLSWFLAPFVKQVRSGKTGYAWIIDSTGRFLYHPQASFVGLKAFDARRSRDPDISHHRINTIEKEKMLKGLEGTGFYHSGWHRGITGKIEKLIAYSPVTIGGHPPRKWSVAVVAPVFEIEEALRKISVGQLWLQGLILLVIVAGGGGVLVLEMRLSCTLEQTVRERTRALRRSEENYRSLVESAEDLIFTVDKEGRLVSVNSFTAHFFGSHPEQLVGKGLDHLLPSSTAQRQTGIVGSVYAKGKSIRDEFEIRLDNSEIWLSANFMPIKNAKGDTSAVLCIARDITENKKLERHLINTEKLASLGTLAAGVAHEINNPLSVILGFCDILLRKQEAGSREYEDLKIIERQGLNCKQIVENLLSFARVGAAATPDTDLNPCLEEVLKVVQHSLELKQVQLRIDLEENLPRVRGDSRQLQQVFLNLINNACAAMPNGGRLTITTYPGRGRKMVIAQVQDQGQGIPPDVIDHIFEPFFTTKGEGEGTGLGLFVSYGIIHKFGGSIVCESNRGESPAAPRGTTFSVALPAADRREECREKS